MKKFVMKKVTDKISERSKPRDPRVRDNADGPNPDSPKRDSRYIDPQSSAPRQQSPSKHDVSHEDPHPFPKAPHASPKIPPHSPIDPSNFQIPLPSWVAPSPSSINTPSQMNPDYSPMVSPSWVAPSPSSINTPSQMNPDYSPMVPPSWVAPSPSSINAPSTMNPDYSPMVPPSWVAPSPSSINAPSTMNPDYSQMVPPSWVAPSPSSINAPSTMNPDYSPMAPPSWVAPSPSSINTPSPMFPPPWVVHPPSPMVPHPSHSFPPPPFPSNPTPSSSFDPTSQFKAPHHAVPPPFFPSNESNNQQFRHSSNASQHFPLYTSNAPQQSYRLPFDPSQNKRPTAPPPVSHYEQRPRPPVPDFTVRPPPPKPFPAKTFLATDTGDRHWVPHALPELHNPQQSEPPVLENDNGQEWVDNWILKKGITIKKKECSPKTELKICELKGMFDKSLRLVSQLENASLTLSVMAKTVTPEEWDAKWEEVEELKKQLEIVTNQLKSINPEEIETLKKKIHKRNQKRERLKRQAERRKKEKEDAEVRCRNLHIHIDNWQKQMQEEEERVYEEKRLAREADALLYEVNQQKADTKRQLDLLASLRELRKVREQRLSVANSKTQDSHTFDAVVVRLQRMWKRREDECALEERIVKMAVEEETVKSDTVKRFKKLVLNEWEMAIFGAVGPIGNNVHGEELIKIRREWDRFAVKLPAFPASTIPPGYVLPVPPSSDEWRAFLKYEQ